MNDLRNGIFPVHQRLAELYLLNKKRALTPEEMKEVQDCLKLNAEYCWDMAALYNKSLLASMTNDVDWQHEICAELDNVGKPKESKRRPKSKKAARPPKIDDQPE